MKTFQHVILLIVFLHLGNNVKAQHLKLCTATDTCSKSLIVENETKRLSKFSYNELDAEFTYYPDGEPITNKVEFPVKGKKLNWFIIRTLNQLYFAYSTFEHNIYTLYLAPYKYKENIVGEPKVVIQTPSELNPDIYAIKGSVISNNDCFRVAFISHKSNRDIKNSGAITKNLAVSVIDYDLNILYSTSIHCKYPSSELEYDIETGLAEDGTLYRFGILFEGDKEEKKCTYGGFITTTEGNTSEFISIPIPDLGYVTHVNTQIENDKIIQYGTWSKRMEPNEVSGTFYIELSKVDLKVLHTQIKTIPVSELSSFCNNPWDSDFIVKNQSIYSINMMPTGRKNLQFANGNYVTVLTREHTAQGQTFNLSAFFIATFGPNDKDMTFQMVRINQRMPTLDPTNKGPRVGFESGVTMLDNHLVIIFNDNIENASVVNKGEVKEFKPYPGDTETIATFALIMDEKCKISRNQVMSYAKDNLLFHEMSSNINNESLFIYTVNDTNFNYFNPKHESKVSQRVVQLIR